MNIRENAEKGIISTTLGATIVVASIASVFVPELGIDWANASIGMGVGLGLIGFVNK